MPSEILNELYEIVVSICDNLYASKELINRKTVKRIVMLQGNWSAEELDLLIPKYINQWRLYNLSLDSHVHGGAGIMQLEAQLSKYREDLLHAKQLIIKLRTELRGMLNA